jgi:uncharacterized protein YjiS (DUF1127 family)
LPTHRLLLDIANMQKVPVSRCSLETADYSLTFVMVELGMEPIATKRGGEDPMIEHDQGEGPSRACRRRRPETGTLCPSEMCLGSHRRIPETSIVVAVSGIAGIFWEQAMSVMSLSKTVTYRSSGWSKLESLLGEWWHRVSSRYDLESLSERDLADMGMTRIDAFNEIQKPFWQA